MTISSEVILIFVNVNLKQKKVSCYSPGCHKRQRFCYLRYMKLSLNFHRKCLTNRHVHWHSLKPKQQDRQFSCKPGVLAPCPPLSFDKSCEKSSQNEINSYKENYKFAVR